MVTRYQFARERGSRDTPERYNNCRDLANFESDNESLFREFAPRKIVDRSTKDDRFDVFARRNIHGTKYQPHFQREGERGRQNVAAAVTHRKSHIHRASSRLMLLSDES